MARAWPRLLALAFALALAGCAGRVFDAPFRESQALPETNAPMPGSVEPEPGANDSIEHRKLLAEYGGRYDDAKVAAMVAGIVGRLSAAAGPMNAPLRLTILNSATVNAFALPDGGLYVTRGLIALANDESELAAVIAHEIAHVQADHARLRQRQASAAQLAQRVSEVVNDPMIRADSAGQAVTSLARFSQQQELEADEEGVKLTAAAGFDPFAAARFLRSMQRFAALPTLNSASAEQPGFLSTHPSAPDRIDRATRTARQFGSPGATNKPSGSFLRSIDGNMFGDDPSEGFVRGREFVHVDMGIAFTVPDGYTLRNTSAAVLATDGENTAIRFDAARDTARGDLEAKSSALPIPEWRMSSRCTRERYPLCCGPYAVQFAYLIDALPRNGILTCFPSTAYRISVTRTVLCKPDVRFSPASPH